MLEAAVTLRLTNRCETARKLVIEPWTTEFRLQPGHTYDLVISGDLGLPLEVEFEDDELTVYTFDSANASFKISEGGAELKPL